MKIKIVVVLLFGIWFLGFLSCGGSEKNPFLDKKQNSGSDAPPREQVQEKKVYSGGELYSQKCTACHGSDGNLGVGGAKKISESTLTQEEREELIANGKKTMPAFKEQLSSEEIKALAEYTFTLK